FVIGGFHLTLIAGWIFAFFYLLVRLIPPLYRRVPARVPALVCVWMGLLFYLALSGAAVSTMRAFVMATLGFLALIFARHILTMRNICLCFALIILINPHYIMEAGFQMSFAAVFGILYLFSDRRYIPKTPVRRAWHAVRDVLMATLIATVFTMPFVAYNFHTVQIYGFLGNLLAMPIFAFAIIPLVVIGTILGAGFGHFLALDTAAYVYGFAMRITNWIASLPHAVINVPRIPGISVILFVISAIIVMFIIGHKRAKIIIASILIAIAVLIAVMMPKPIFYATPDHELVAFMTDNGHLQFNRGHDATHKMTFDSWDQLNGDPAGADHVPIKLGYAGATYSTNCDDKVCVYKTPNWKLTYVQQFVPLYKNIARICDADPGPNDKRSASLGGDGSGFLVTFFDIDAPECGAKIIRGGLVIYETGRIEYVRANRIWDK
ncbi:MAG: ComEC/Rec2 family competence protein, partial [Proteobacteria bacterium]|nr:ComEC/Rec2 family competence protein [Pseudomonadota bacterium]